MRRTSVRTRVDHAGQPRHNAHISKWSFWSARSMAESPSSLHVVSGTPVRQSHRTSNWFPVSAAQITPTVFWCWVLAPRRINIMRAGVWRSLIASLEDEAACRQTDRRNRCRRRLMAQKSRADVTRRLACQTMFPKVHHCFCKSF